MSRRFADVVFVHIERSIAHIYVSRVALATVWCQICERVVFESNVELLTTAHLVVERSDHVARPVRDLSVQPVVRELLDIDFVKQDVAGQVLHHTSVDKMPKVSAASG